MAIVVPMTREEKIRISILNEAKKCHGKKFWHYEDPFKNKIALELIKEGLVVGDLGLSGLPFIIGIHDAGLEYLESKKFHKRVIARFKKMEFVVYSLALVIFGFLLNYIFNLDPVKKFFSDLIGNI